MPDRSLVRTEKRQRHSLLAYPLQRLVMVPLAPAGRIMPCFVKYPDSFHPMASEHHARGMPTKDYSPRFIESSSCFRLPSHHSGVPRPLLRPNHGVTGLARVPQPAPRVTIKSLAPSSGMYTCVPSMNTWASPGAHLQTRLSQRSRGVKDASSSFW